MTAISATKASIMSVPGMAESIIEGGNTPLEECLSEDEVEW